MISGNRSSTAVPLRRSSHYILSFVFSVLFLTMTFTALPTLAFDPPWKGTKWESIQGHVFPQGWGFFTRSAQEPLVTPWSKDGLPLSHLPTSRWVNFFGLNREGRAQGVEVGSLQSQLSDEQWTSCADLATPTRCLQKAKVEGGDKFSVHSTTRSPSLCGEIMLLETKPADFMYRSYVDEDIIAVRFARIDVHCASRP